MKLCLLAAASGFALCAVGTALPASGQENYPAPNEGQVDTNGLPTTRSTPQEQAETSALNEQSAAAANATNSQAAADNAQYQQQQRQYQEQEQQYQQQLQQNQMQQQHYQDRTTAYEGLRSRYAAERAAYHRGIWPDSYVHWVLQGDANLIGERVELLSGNRVGTVVDTARAPSGAVEGLLVRLDDDRLVWIDSQDVRFNRADGVVMTDLEATDLHHMADERL